MSEEIYKDLIVLADKIDFIEGRQEKLEVAVDSALKDVGASAEFLSTLRQDVDEAPKRLEAEAQKHVALIQSEGDSIKIQLARLELSTRANAAKAEGAAEQMRTLLEQRVEQFRLERERNDSHEVRTELAAAKERLATVEAFAAKVGSELASQFNLNPCGCYSPDRAYKRGDLVEINGSSYISLENGNTDKPSKKSKRWMLSAGRGGTMAIGGAGSGGEGVTNGNKVDVTVVDAATWTINDEAITNAKVATGAAIAWAKVDKTGAVKGDVGLGNVDNTSDANKPVSTAAQTALDLKAPTASPTFTGPITSSGARVATSTAMGSTVIDVTKLDNTYSATGDVTLTFSATPATDTVFGVTVTTDSSTPTIGYPESQSANRGASITSSTFPANMSWSVYWRKTATGYRIINDPMTAAQVKAALAITVDDVTGTLPVAKGGTGVTSPSLVAGTNISVTGTWPNQTVTASGGGGGSSSVVSGGSASTDFTFVETIGSGNASTDFSTLAVVHGSNASVTF